ncbi:MAG: hypothetical protein JRG91_17555, partial [Deltaproteobacteria bacterium]|nr:hypothetical protein [Deltaproteobacteria bacterium]
LYFQRLDGACALVGSTVHFIDTYHTSLTNNAMPHMVWAATSFGLVYISRTTDSYFYFTQVDVDGTAIGSTTQPSWGRVPKMVWTGSEYGMTWLDNAGSSSQTRFMIMNADGSERVAWMRVDDSLGYNYGQTLTWTGSEFGVFWRHGGTDGNIHFTRVTPGGSEVGSDQVVVSTSGSSLSPKVTWSGSEFGLAWRDDTPGTFQPYFKRLSPTGSTVGSEVRVASMGGDANVGSLLWTGSEYAIVWSEDIGGATRVYFNLISPTGAIARTEIPVTGTTSNGVGPYMTWTGNEFGVTYRDDADGTWDVMFNRIGFCD